MSSNQEIVTRYLDCLRDADEAGIDALFTKSARIHSPLYGEIDARPFFAKLFSVTEKSELELIDVFDRSTSGDRIAAHFRYTWTLANQEVSTLECVDLFRIERRRIAELMIIYDTYDARAKHARAEETHEK